MPWTIQGDGEPQSPGGYDGSIWQWELVADDDANSRRQVLVQISGTVMSMGEEALPARVAMARETSGRSEIEVICEWPEPPAEIDVHSRGAQPVGGDPGPELREINEIVEWFDERGAILVFAARGGGSGPIESIHMSKHSAHVLARDEDKYLYHAEGLSRLEAARAAKERWAVEGIPPSEPESEPKLTATFDRATVKTLGMEGYRIVWTEPTEPDDPIWLGQVFDDDAKLLAMAIGKDPEDVLIELADVLLPKDSQPKPPESPEQD
jgi:hypothetical protein